MSLYSQVKRTILIFLAFLMSLTVNLNSFQSQQKRQSKISYLLEWPKKNLLLAKWYLKNSKDQLNIVSRKTPSLLVQREVQKRKRDLRVKHGSARPDLIFSAKAALVFKTYHLEKSSTKIKILVYSYLAILKMFTKLLQRMRAKSWYRILSLLRRKKVWDKLKLILSKEDSKEIKEKVLSNFKFLLNLTASIFRQAEMEIIANFCFKTRQPLLLWTNSLVSSGYSRIKL